MEYRLINAYPEEWDDILRTWFSYGKIQRFYLCKFKEDIDNYYLYNYHDECWQDFGKNAFEIISTKFYRAEIDKIIKEINIREVIE